eukprot:9154703-Alexandrium_andersonii.AAC.1
MSASLVGSEMCIRDRCEDGVPVGPRSNPVLWGPECLQAPRLPAKVSPGHVSGIGLAEAAGKVAVAILQVEVAGKVLKVALHRPEHPI